MRKNIDLLVAGVEVVVAVAVTVTVAVGLCVDKGGTHARDCCCQHSH